jgi:hypothetical protein
VSTRTLHVICNTRPLRLAFLLDKPDPVSLEEVLRLNTLFWGGLLNPIVVLDGSARKQLGAHYSHIEMSYEQEVLLTLREFDPDILINYSNAAIPASLDSFKDRIFARDALRWNPWGTEEISFVLGIWWEVDLVQRNIPQGPTPDCELRGLAFSQHWATELQVFGASDEERTSRLPWLHPECDSLVDRKFGHGFGPASSRLSKQGIVVIRRGERENIWIEEPRVTEVLRAFLKDGGSRT